MGKVTVAIKLTNWDDVRRLADGTSTDPGRSHTAEAIVDTGATGFYLKQSLIDQLGLAKVGEKRGLTMSNRWETRAFYSPVELEIQGRTALVQPVALPDGLPNIVGQVPLELMDWVIDMQGRKLIGNPAHGGEEMWEEFGLLRG